MNAVPTRARAHIDHRIPGAGRLGVENFFLLADPQRENIHQRVAIVARLENALAAHRRHAEAVAVVRDARHHAAQNAAVTRARCGIVQAAEAQRIQHHNRPRAHGEDIPQNAADARGRALKRLDKAGVVVRLDLERDHVAAADIDNPRVLARALHHQAAPRRQLLQMQPRALVGTVLAPHHAENTQLRVAGLPSQDGDDLPILVRSQLMLRDHFGRVRRHARTTAWSTDWKIVSPSVEPISGSDARSGCGIIPITLRSRFRIPAMSPSDPLGLPT